MSWPTDRSRFLDGFSCSWKRLLRFHAFGSGIERQSLYAPLMTGISIHSALEAVLKAGATTREEVSNLLAPVLSDYVTKNIDTQFENPADDIRQQIAIVEALAHAYTRITVPWLHDNFDILAVEEDKAIELPGGILWRSREDFLTRMKTNNAVNHPHEGPYRENDPKPMKGKLAIHDFKSASYWSDSDADQWRDSLQQMLNAYVASLHYGERVEHYYIHILIKGSKKSPSYLTHPSYRPGNPPLVAEEILPHYTAKKGYARVFAPTIPLLIPEWVWSMDAAYAAKAVPVVGPFPVDYAKVERFLAGLPRNEQSWMDRLAGLDWTQWADPTFQRKLDELFPRTFNCYEFGGRRCQFYSICHRAAGWEDPLGSKTYRVRKPHHEAGEEDFL